MGFHASARAFLCAVQARYRALPAYSDRGIVKTYPVRPDEALHRDMQRFSGFPTSAKRSFAEVLWSYRETRQRLKGRPLAETPFDTACLRPNKFRFAWTDSHPYAPLRHRKIHAVLGCDGEGVFQFRRLYDGKETLERGLTMEMAVAAATGVSHGAAHTIGTLLFEECGDNWLLDLRRPRFRGQQEIDGVRCVAVSGRDRRGRRVKAWFGVEDLMLRRLLECRSRSEELRFDVSTSEPPLAFSFDAASLSA